MPVYEFYCPDCHRIFNFLSARIDTEKRPECPKCGRPDLERQVSLFAISKGRKEGEGDSFPDIDEDRLEKAMASLASEAEGLDENDPRQAAGLMRRLFDATGMEMGSGMEEAIRRMEAGEDPDQIEEELGDVLEQEDPFGGLSGVGGKGLKTLRKKYLRPEVDEKLYRL
ncbi:MAG TPA: zinc ribbon domain-containing protein [Thermodesulfobacteriaceae bacterium]|nr:zinc ribbon domain-containing protein [Thermodesulfobacteriaceae bacterium]